MSGPMYSPQKLPQLIHTQHRAEHTSGIWHPLCGVCRWWVALWNPQASERWISSPPSYFCHLSPLRDTDGLSIHLCASSDGIVCPEKKIAEVTDTEDQRKEHVAQSNEEYIWLKDRRHGYCSLLHKYFRRSFFSPDMQRHSLN